MTCAEFKENVAALALQALDPAERERCEAHLATAGPHEGCEEAFRKAIETTALIGAALPPAKPAPELWSRIAAHLEAERPTLDAGGAGRAARAADAAGARPWRWREAAAWTLALAASAVAFVTAVEYRHSEQRLLESQNELARADDLDRQRVACLNELASARISARLRAQAISLIESPGTRVVPLAAQGGAPYRASAIVTPGVSNAVLVASELKPEEGKDFQLWLIRGQDKVSAGILHPDPTGMTIAAIPPEILSGGAPDAFAITLEPTGGMPQPTGPIVLVGALPKI